MLEKEVKLETRVEKEPRPLRKLGARFMFTADTVYETYAEFIKFININNYECQLSLKIPPSMPPTPSKKN